MRKTYCDICNKQVDAAEDLRYIQILDANSKPKIVEKECCVSCAEAVKNFIGKIGGLGGDAVEVEKAVDEHVSQEVLSREQG